jgi:hypothetical protein
MKYEYSYLATVYTVSLWYKMEMYSKEQREGLSCVEKHSPLVHHANEGSSLSAEALNPDWSIFKFDCQSQLIGRVWVANWDSRRLFLLAVGTETY